MWNAVCLHGMAMIKRLNLDVAAEKLCLAIDKISDVDKMKISNAENEKLKKAQKLLNQKKTYIDITYELIKKNGLSKNVFKRTLTYSCDKKIKTDLFYVNYKFLNYIIEEMVKYILLVDKGIMNDLLKISSETYAGEDSITFRTIPVRKVLIKNVRDAYENNKEIPLKNTNIKRKLCLLDKKLDKININIIVGGAL